MISQSLPRSHITQTIHIKLLQATLTRKSKPHMDDCLGNSPRGGREHIRFPAEYNNKARGIIHLDILLAGCIHITNMDVVLEDDVDCVLHP